MGPGDAVKDLVVELEFQNWKGDPQTIKIKYLTCFGPKLDGGDAVANDFLDKVNASNEIRKAWLAYIGMTDCQMISDDTFCIT